MLKEGNNRVRGTPLLVLNNTKREHIPQIQSQEPSQDPLSSGQEVAAVHTRPMQAW